MEAERFEHVLRTLTTSPSRRQALGGVLGAILGGTSLVGVAKGKKGKGGGKGKGKGKAKKCVDSRRITICHNGQTIGVSNCALPAHQRHGDPLGPCPPFSCIGQPDLTDCGEGKKCSGGVCATEPACGGNGTTCDANPDCCSEFCAGLLVCAAGDPGQPCHVDTDCASSNCVGFVCQAA